MIVTKSISDYKRALCELSNRENIGFVPTMGALHQGHISLVEESIKTCDITVVSIFVNPTQFNNPNDLKSYPRTLENDCALLEKIGVDIVFAPTIEDIYPTPDNRVFDFEGIDKFGEGPRRPGHFNGVAQVVTRLFDIVEPKYAFFGEKDFQQLAIIRYFAERLNYKINIVGCPTLRESDGLAMSSRNLLLTPEQRGAAPHIYETLCKARTYMEQMSPSEVIEKLTQEINSNPHLETEYIEIIDSKTLSPVKDWKDSEQIRVWCAIFALPVRLIDNIKLK